MKIITKGEIETKEGQLKIREMRTREEDAGAAHLLIFLLIFFNKDSSTLKSVVES